MDWTDRRERLRAIIAGPRCIYPGSVFDAISARIAEDLGFEAGMFAGSIASFAVLGAPDEVLIVRDAPGFTELSQVSLGELYRISPLGAIGTLGTGLYLLATQTAYKAPYSTDSFSESAWDRITNLPYAQDYFLLLYAKILVFALEDRACDLQRGKKQVVVLVLLDGLDHIGRVFTLAHDHDGLDDVVLVH